MQQPTEFAISLCTGTCAAAATALGLTPLAVAAAIVGAVASLHFEPPASGTAAWRVLGQVAALAVLAAFLASVTYVMLPAPEVPVAARAGLLGIFANPCYQWARVYLEKRKKGDETQAGGKK